MTVRTLPVFGLLLVADVAAAGSLSTSGSCPGVVTIDIQNFSPNGQFALLSGNAGGNNQIPAGPCAGTPTQLGNIALRALGNLNNGGDAQLTPNVPNGACSQKLQVLDVNTCQLSQPTSIGTQCANLNVPVANSGPAGQMADPTFMGISTSNIIGNGRAEDVTFTNAALGSIADSAQLDFTFFDAAFTVLCTIRYDLSSAVPDNGFSTDSGAPFIDPLTLSLTGGDSDCGNVTVAKFGSADLRVFLAQSDWSVAYGPIQNQFETDLTAAVNASGGNYAADFDPFVFSTYSVQTGSPAFESSFAFSFERTCDEVELDNAGLLLNELDKPTGPLDAYVQSQVFLVFQL